MRRGGHGTSQAGGGASQAGSAQDGSGSGARDGGGSGSGARDGGGSGSGSGARDGGWRDARRELAVAAALVSTLATASYALVGAAAAGLVVLVCVAVSLVILRTLIDPESEPAESAEPFPASPVQSFTGFWRARADLTAGTRSLDAWDRGPRRKLQNLLAARLAERHGIHLANDSDSARRLLLGAGSSRRDLWYWIDPQRPTPPDAHASPGITPAALAALIEKLEQL
jgi:hypothetical protein